MYVYESIICTILDIEKEICCHLHKKRIQYNICPEWYQHYIDEAMKFDYCHKSLSFYYICHHNCNTIWVRSRNCGCHVTWFCYQLIAKPGNKTAAVPWPDPYGQACQIFNVTGQFVVWKPNWGVNNLLRGVFSAHRVNHVRRPLMPFHNHYQNLSDSVFLAVLNAMLELTC